MWPHSLFKIDPYLVRQLAGGRCKQQGELRLTLTLERSGGSGLICPLVVSRKRCQAWCASNSWCHWIAPQLTVNDFTQINATLLPLLAVWSWTLAPPFIAGLDDAMLQVESPALGTVPYAWNPVLKLHHFDRCLHWQLLDWPTEWLVTQTHAWETLHAEQVTPHIAVTLALGWAFLSYAELKQLQVGEGLLLHGTVNIQQNRAWLFHQYPLAKLHLLTPTQAEVEAMMEESEEWHSQKAGKEAIPLTVVAEIGEWKLPITALSQLHVGQVLTAPAHFTGEVRLKVNGSVLGHATLLEVGGAWIARIDQLIAQQPFVTENGLIKESDSTEWYALQDREQHDVVSMQQAEEQKIAAATGATPAEKSPQKRKAEEETVIVQQQLPCADCTPSLSSQGVDDQMSLIKPAATVTQKNKARVTVSNILSTEDHIAHTAMQPTSPTVSSQLTTKQQEAKPVKGIRKKSLVAQPQLHHQQRKGVLGHRAQKREMTQRVAPRRRAEAQVVQTYTPVAERIHTGEIASTLVSPGKKTVDKKKVSDLPHGPCE